MISDRFIIEFDKALRTLCAPASTVREVPGSSEAESPMSAAEKTHAAALMRVNHVGEICAQALYQGQALTSRQADVRQALALAAREETEHLAWTERRLAELGSRTSLLNPVWYLGALVIGVVAGKLGDDWSLGFLAETERQVEAHLSDHLERLPPDDHASAAILRQMREDEAQHARLADSLGAAPLPLPVRLAMRVAADSMKAIARYV